MVIGIIDESCTGKSTLADKLKPLLGAEVYTGKDYLRLAKNEAIAKKLFQKKLKDAVSGPHIIYVISEKEYLTLVPGGALKVLVTADLDAIKERFAQRMRGNLIIADFHDDFCTIRRDMVGEQLLDRDAKGYWRIMP